MKRPRFSQAHDSLKLPGAHAGSERDAVKPRAGAPRVIACDESLRAVSTGGSLASTLREHALNFNILATAHGLLLWSQPAAPNTFGRKEKNNVERSAGEA